MKTVTLKIQDDYFDKIISFLEILPKKAVIIEQQNEEEKLKDIEKNIISAFEDIKQGKTKKVRTVAWALFLVLLLKKLKHLLKL